MCKEERNVLEEEVRNFRECDMKKLLIIHNMTEIKRSLSKGIDGDNKKRNRKVN